MYRNNSRMSFSTRRRFRRYLKIVLVLTSRGLRRRNTQRSSSWRQKSSIQRPKINKIRLKSIIPISLYKLTILRARYCYDEPNATDLINHLNTLADGSDANGERNLPFSRILNVLWESQLLNRIREIAPLTEAFQKLDPQSTGLLDHPSFALLWDRMTQEGWCMDVQLKEALEILDPFGSGQISFSSTVSLLFGNPSWKQVWWT